MLFGEYGSFAWGIFAVLVYRVSSQLAYGALGGRSCRTWYVVATVVLVLRGHFFAISRLFCWLSRSGWSRRCICRRVYVSILFFPFPVKRPKLVGVYGLEAHVALRCWDLFFVWPKDVAVCHSENGIYVRSV